MHCTVYIFCIAIYLETFQSIFGGIICPWSKQTAKKVASCPNNRKEMEIRAGLKECELKAHEQNCSSIEKIKYHCVMNELEDAFIEVCAPVYHIHDKGCNNVVKKKLCGSSETSALSCPVTQYSSTDIYWLVSSTRSPTGNLTDSEIRYNTKDWKPYNGAATITTTVTTITTALIFNALIFIGGILMFDVYKKWRTKQRYKEQESIALSKVEMCLLN